MAKVLALMMVCPPLGCSIPPAPRENVAPSLPACTATRCACVDRALTLSDIVGTFHAVGYLDANNLVLREDGTFSRDGYYCDGATGGHGIIVEYGGIVLIPETESFPGPSSGSSSPSSVRTSYVEVSLCTSGRLVTTTAEGSLHWAPGRVCSICEGQGSGRHSEGTEPCDCHGRYMIVPDVPPCDES